MYRAITNSNNSHSDSKRTLYDGKYLPCTIKFCGHSLPKANYSYFTAIFDRFKLYAEDVKLLFYCPKDKEDIAINF